VIKNRICLTVGGLCFELVSDGAPILHEVTEPYRYFTSEAPVEAAGETVNVRVSVADVKPRSGRQVFDGGSWRLLAHGSERSFVFQTRFMTEPLYEACFYPGAPEVELVCSPRLLEVQDGVTCIRSHFCYPLDQVLTMYLLGDTGLVLHAAGVVHGGRALAFAGVSGAGKSTLVRLAAGWSGAAALNDDRIILRLQEGTVMAYGTPWPGEAAVAENRMAETCALLFLDKGPNSRVRPISRRETLVRLMPTVSLPWSDPEYLDAGLRACDTLIRRVPAAVFTFRPDDTALDALDAFLAQP
jgi:hypothetical protein